MLAQDSPDLTNAKIVVLGSINMDLIARCHALPLAGQTLTASGFQQIRGGKGANQAVAASLVGSSVRMLGRVGEDGLAASLIDELKQDGVHCSQVLPTPNVSSGLAMITVSDDAENQIVVIPGANAHVDAATVDQFADVISMGDVLLLQLEIPLPAVLRAKEIAQAAGVRVILDPAPIPATPLPADLFEVDLICPNETEALEIVGRHAKQNATAAQPQEITAWQNVAEQLHQQGSRNVIITLGKQGVLFFDGNQHQHLSAQPVDAIDTTCAGDAFAGALAAKWAATNDLIKAIEFGNQIAALSTTATGLTALRTE
ncbi:MAG: hypothetical protein CBB71_02055 [Rhodopirellula sp. TMED11]|nr:MAG: hypothetical protein CBB71_02055 [Rhodopirellula sp. TMED11]